MHHFSSDLEGLERKVVVLRPRDIATYVARGVIDLGITGRDLNEDAQTPALEVDSSCSRQ